MGHVTLLILVPFRAGVAVDGRYDEDGGRRRPSRLVVAAPDAPCRRCFMMRDRVLMNVLVRTAPLAGASDGRQVVVASHHPRRLADLHRRRAVAERAGAAALAVIGRSVRRRRRRPRRRRRAGSAVVERRRHAGARNR